MCIVDIRINLTSSGTRIISLPAAVPKKRMLGCYTKRETPINDIYSEREECLSLALPPRAESELDGAHRGFHRGQTVRCPRGSNEGDIDHERAADKAWASFKEGGERESGKERGSEVRIRERSRRAQWERKKS